MSKAPDDVVKTAERIRWRLAPDFNDRLVEALYSDASRIAARAGVGSEARRNYTWETRVDRILTSRVWGFPAMGLLFALALWTTIIGANVPSALLSSFLVDWGHPALKGFVVGLGAPGWLSGILVDGVYLASAWVVSVMLPPMAIFFPMFTLLEDLGYLPRVAFNLDALFKAAGAHGKQSLSMVMGFGCNAAGVVATRIIDSPRERFLAIITNNFALCNGRWPTQILIATIFIGALAPPHWAGAIAAVAVLAVASLGVVLTFLVSWALSRTVLRGEVSAFSLELPPYRPPQILRTLYTSLIDRTMFVLFRAVVFAAPAGAVIWIVANVTVGDRVLAAHLVDWLGPLGWLMGLNGVILLAYIIAIPANEIVIPTVLMLTVLMSGLNGVGAGAGVMFSAESGGTAEILRAGGWTLLTAVNLMLFSLMHNPCSTTIYTIWKETGSVKWTALSTFLPLFLGMAVCASVAFLWRFFGG